MHDVHDAPLLTAGPPPTYDKPVATELPGIKEKIQVLVQDTADKTANAASDTAERLKTAITQNPTVLETSENLRKNFSPESHELAVEDYGLKGAVQNHASERPIDGVRDIGWHKPTVDIPDPLIGGIPNGKLFPMIRRFNKDVFHLKAVDLEVARGLDLNEAWSDQHASDKITLHLQRLYLTIILGMVSFGKQVSRLRSWKETRRTAAFCTTYFAAWYFNLLLPLILGMLVAIISSEEARNAMFPPVPLSLVSITTGGLQKPAAGQLGTTNTLTGAPEKEVGEAVEEEAANFVDNARHLIGRTIGMHESEGNEGDPLESKIPKPIKKAAKAVKAAGTAPGHASDNTDMTQEPMEELIWSRVKPEKIEPIIKLAPHVLGEIVDNWERFANALSPTPPFSPYSYLRLDAVLIPMFLVSLFVDYYMVYKGIGLVIGLVLFGDPIMAPSVEWINRNYPQSLELLEPKNNILRGVPTNNQLTLTLLRIGEANKTPLPPLPTSKPDDIDQPVLIDAEDIPVGESNAAVNYAIQPSPADKLSANEDTEDQPKHKKLSKIMRILKGNSRAIVNTKMAVDHGRAKLGSSKAKDHLGVIPKKKNLIYAGPSEYKGRYDGKNGWVYINELRNSVLFATSDPKEKLETIFEIDLKDIKELRRATALASKPVEMATKWSSDNELLGSVEIDDQNGKTWRLTALPERDELFNRLAAMGNHRWENV